MMDMIHDTGQQGGVRIHITSQPVCDAHVQVSIYPLTNVHCFSSEGLSVHLAIKPFFLKSLKNIRIKYHLHLLIFDQNTRSL